MDIKYPDVEVELSGQDDNAFSIMGRVAMALRRAKVPTEEIDKYKTECLSGDYDHLLQTTMAWVSTS